MLASGFAWLALAGIVIAVPLLIEHVPRFIGSVGGLSGLLALYLGFSAKTQGKENNGTSQNPGEVALALLPKISAPICVVLLLGLLSLGTSSLLEHLSLSVRLTMDDSIGRWDVKGVGMPDLPSAHPYVLHATSLVLLLVIFGCSLVLSMVMAYVVNINTFSLHALYRNRLVRAYLGASHAPREANAFTKFDPADNFEIKDLIQKPFHIINATLNLVSSDNIAWQERKACSFTMSPLHCGSAAHTSSGQLGYRSSTVYGKQKAGAGGKPMTLGTALAISGAAASPNMGYHSSAPVAFLLTLFNIRLGWWLGNPGKAGEKKTITKASAQWERQKAYQVSCPGFALFPLLAEAFGFTDSDHPYVYLSDGGHFENLGLYEMVLRRCRYIVVVDAGCDPEHHFEDLGNAIRKIRIDLGIEVTISKEKNLENLELRPEKQRVVLPYAVGTIGYRKVDEHGKDGTFLYLKPSLTLTDEQPADVLQYHAKHRTFPHESTSDQFFSESQFESYRKLGEYITNVALNDGNKHPDSDLGRLVQALKTKDA